MHNKIAMGIHAYLIPPDALNVLSVVKHVAILGRSKNCKEAHLEAPAYACKAAAISFFNSIAYLKINSTKALKALVSLRGWEVLAAGKRGVVDVLQSLAFAVTSAVMAFFGCFLPRTMSSLLALPKTPRQLNSIAPNSYRYRGISTAAKPSTSQYAHPPQMEFFSATPVSTEPPPQTILPVIGNTSSNSRSSTLSAPYHAPRLSEPTPALTCSSAQSVLLFSGITPLDRAPSSLKLPPLSAPTRTPAPPEPDRTSISSAPPPLEMALASKAIGIPSVTTATDDLLGSFTQIPSAREIPVGDFTNYVARYCPLYKDSWKAIVTKGHELIKMFQKPSADPMSPENSIPKERRREQMAPFVWYLMHLAETRYGKAFQEGMFVFEDPDYRIHDFFSIAATKRASSHFRNSRLSSLGMDIPQDGCTGLPAGHQTAHFGKFETLDPARQYTFLKPETWGTESISQMVGHATSYLATRIPHWMGWSPSAGEYKEHVPAHLKKKFQELYDEISPKEQNRKFLETWGVGAMIWILKDYMKVNPSSVFKERIRRFVIDDLQLSDNWSVIQAGKEIILEDIFNLDGNPMGRSRLYQPLAELFKLLDHS